MHVKTTLQIGVNCTVSPIWIHTHIYIYHIYRFHDTKYTDIHIFLYIRAYLRIHVYSHVCMCIHFHTGTYMKGTYEHNLCTNTHVRMRAHTHICIHIATARRVLANKLYGYMHIYMCVRIMNRFVSQKHEGHSRTKCMCKCISIRQIPLKILHP